VENETLFQISYDYHQKVDGKNWYTYSGNLVGRYCDVPIGYGPVGSPALFRAEELPEVIKVLTKQLGTTPVLHLHPRPW
jgi:hypothetical protein